MTPGDRASGADAKDRSALTPRDLILLLTMPIWLPAIMLAGLAVMLLAAPVVLFGPAYVIGVAIRDGYGSTLALVVGVVAGTALIRFAVSKNVARTISACPRCGHVSPDATNGGRFVCTACGATA